jgi:hypothetical protein
MNAVPGLRSSRARRVAFAQNAVLKHGNGKYPLTEYFPFWLGAADKRWAFTAGT